MIIPFYFYFLSFILFPKAYNKERKTSSNRLIFIPHLISRAWGLRIQLQSELALSLSNGASHEEFVALMFESRY